MVNSSINESLEEKEIEKVLLDCFGKDIDDEKQANLGSGVYSYWAEWL